MQLGLAQFTLQYSTLWPELMAGSIIAIAADPAHLPDLPALLHRRRHGRGGQGMRPRDACVLALRDFYANSWRLVAVNAALGVVLVASILARSPCRSRRSSLLAARARTAAVVVHCSVTLVRTGDLAFADAWEGLRLHWRRGLALGAVGAGLLLLGLVAVRPTLLRRLRNLATRVSDAVRPRPARHLPARPVDARDRRAGVGLLGSVARRGALRRFAGPVGDARARARAAPRQRSSALPRL